MNGMARLGAVGLVIGTLLVAACSAGDQPPAETTPSQPPAIIADAGPNQSVFLGTHVTLDGSKSTNANQTGLTYAWALTKPSNSKATLSDPTLVNPTLTVDVEGTYEATLVVTDAQDPSKKSTPATVTVTASKTNPPPVADAGPTSLNVFTGLPIILDGRQSRDPNGDPLTFRWSVTGKPSGSTPTFRDVSTVAPSFTPDVDGTYTVSLTVNDGTSNSTPASVTIHASPKPSPTAHAGNDQFISTNSRTVTLNGSGSHTNPPTNPPDLQYEWTVNSSTFPVTLTNANKPVATFTVPANTAGTVVAQLKVTEPDHPDRARNSTLATVKVTIGPLAIIQVSADNTPLFTCSAFSAPSCSNVAGVSSTVQTDTKLQFDATTSAVQPLTYQWFLGLDPTPFSTNDTATYTVGSNEADYTFKLIVTDLGKHTDPQSFTLNAKNGAAPNFKVAPNQSVGLGTMVTVTDMTTGSNLTRKWTISDPFGKEITSTDSPFTFTTDKDKAGVYTVLLAITDHSLGAGKPNTKQISITSNKAPTAVIDPPPSFNRCDTVTLDGSHSSDTDGDGVDSSSYMWTVTKPDNTLASLDVTTLSKPKFKPDQHGTYTVQLTVKDNLKTTSPTARRTITTRGFDIHENVGLDPIHKCSECHPTGTSIASLTGKKASTFKIYIRLRPTPTTTIHDPVSKTDTVISMGGPAPDLSFTDSDLISLEDYLNPNRPNCL